MTGTEGKRSTKSARRPERVVEASHGRERHWRSAHAIGIEERIVRSEPRCKQLNRSNFRSEANLLVFGDLAADETSHTAAPETTEATVPRSVTHPLE
jgi:hypothetical protein